MRNLASREGGFLDRDIRTRALRPVLFGLLAITAGLLASPAYAAPSYLEGIDVSHHNGTVDWAAVKNAGIRFAFAKATDGQSFVDDRYSTNQAEADALALPFGAYHFAEPDKTPDDAILEADHFLAVANLRGRHLLPVLDLEVNGGLGARKLRAWAKAWLARVEAVLGVKPIIYSSPSFWNVRVGGSRWFADHGYRLWIAHWGANQPTVPAHNWGGRGWTFWQYNDRGAVDGVQGNVDLDHFRGSDINPLRIRNNR